MIRLINRKLLDEVSDEARNTPRRRKNRNFHSGDDAPAHRLLNAIEPGSYVVPHRHLAATKDETMIVLRGRLGLVLFDNAGTVVRSVLLDAGGDVSGVDIPCGTWHSVLSLAPGSVFFEAKAGPYLPFTAEERAPWAPAENDAAAGAYLNRLQVLFTAEAS